jgi:ankyrin repeat protein
LSKQNLEDIDNAIQKNKTLWIKEFFTKNVTTIDYQDKDGKTFLIHAILQTKIPIVKQLLLMNANPTICEYK